MSFIDHYLKNYNLEEIPKSTQKKLEKLEKKLAQKVDNNPTESTFDDIITKYGEQIADIIGRFSDYWKDVSSWSVSSVVGTLRFVINIGVEVKQLVEAMRDDIVTDDMTDKEQTEDLKNFAKDLIYFIWKIVDPLNNRFTWLPFRERLEKWLVMKIADMAVDFAGDYIDSHYDAMNAEDNIRVKVL